MYRGALVLYIWENKISHHSAGSSKVPYHSNCTCIGLQISYEK